jgi:hypothetical protein
MSGYETLEKQHSCPVARSPKSLRRRPSPNLSKWPDSNELPVRKDRPPRGRQALQRFPRLTLIRSPLERLRPKIGFSSRRLCLSFQWSSRRFATTIVRGLPQLQRALRRARTPRDLNIGAGRRSSGRLRRASAASSVSSRAFKTGVTGWRESRLLPAPSATPPSKLISECFRCLSWIRGPRIHTAPRVSEPLSISRKDEQFLS